MTVSIATRQIDCIIFDKDGTLVDLHAPWGRWARDVAERLAANVPPDELLAYIGWDATTGRIRPETPLAVATVDETRTVFATALYARGLGWTAASATARAAVAAATIMPSPPVCPLQPLFAQLRANAVRIAVVTSDDHAGAIRDLEPLGVLPYIDAILGGDSGVAVKPAPDAVHAIAEQTGVAVERIAVCGDSLADLVMGRAAKVGLTIGVLSGSGTAEILAPHADMIIASACVFQAYLSPPSDEPAASAFSK